MRRSTILRSAAVFLLPLLLLFSLILLLRGHDQPGGGFVGGLVAASAFAVYAMAYGAAATRRLLGVGLNLYIGVGLLLALGSGLVALIPGGGVPGVFLTGVWSGELDAALIPLKKLGTPQLFDLGVYLTVLGVVLTMVFTLAESATELGASEPGPIAPGDGGPGVAGGGMP